MMKFAFKMMIFAFKMITFALQMMNCGGATKRVVGSLKMEFHWEKPSAFFAARCFYIEMKPSFNGEQKILSAEKWWFWGDQGAEGLLQGSDQGETLADWWLRRRKTEPDPFDGVHWWGSDHRGSQQHGWWQRRGLWWTPHGGSATVAVQVSGFRAEMVAFCWFSVDLPLNITISIVSVGPSHPRRGRLVGVKSARPACRKRVHVYALAGSRRVTNPRAISSRRGRRPNWKWHRFVFKMMDFAFNVMDYVSKMMNFVLKWWILCLKWWIWY